MAKSAAPSSLCFFQPAMLDVRQMIGNRNVNHLEHFVVAQALFSLPLSAQAGLFGPSAGEQAALILREIIGVPILVGGAVAIIGVIAFAIIKIAQLRRTPTPARTQFEFDIFLSYSEKDKDQASRLADQLQQSGLKVFYARQDLDGGSRFTDEIRGALNDSREVWVLASPNSINSVWVATEWGTAWALNKRIVPILFETNVEALPDRLRALQTVKLLEVEKEVRKAINRSKEKMAVVSEKKLLIAAMLCVFFGVFGLHNFYVGKLINGIGQIAVLAVLGFAVGAWPLVLLWPLADLIMMLLGHFSDKDGKRLIGWGMRRSHP